MEGGREGRREGEGRKGGRGEEGRVGNRRKGKEGGASLGVSSYNWKLDDASRGREKTQTLAS